jgi:pimeloyl-ACP methyl ester carboxylesterase
MASREHQVLTRDGRRVQVLERGVPGWRAVLVHGGTPNSPLMSDPDVACADRHGVRVISYDRPGYSGFSRRAGRTVGDCAEDVRTIAQALGISRLGVWGISGGGLHAIACAALLPDLVSAVAVCRALQPPRRRLATDLDHAAARQGARRTSGHDGRRGPRRRRQIPARGSGCGDDHLGAAAART